MSLAQSIGVIVGSISILTAIGGAFVYLWKNLIKPSIHFIKETNKTNEKIDKIYYEISPNSGSSMKDKINKISDDLIYMNNKQDALIQIMPFATLQMDEKGHCNYVNRIWCDMTGMDEQSAMGNGWLDSIVKEERESVRERMEDAIENNYFLHLYYTIQNKQTNEKKNVKSTSIMVKSSTGELRNVISLLSIA